MAWQTDNMCADILHLFHEARRVGDTPGCRRALRAPLLDELDREAQGTLDASTGFLTLSWRRSEPPRDWHRRR